MFLPQHNHCEEAWMHLGRRTGAYRSDMGKPPSGASSESGVGHAARSARKKPARGRLWGASPRLRA